MLQHIVRTMPTMEEVREEQFWQNRQAEVPAQRAAGIEQEALSLQAIPLYAHSNYHRYRHLYNVA